MKMQRMLPILVATSLIGSTLSLSAEALVTHRIPSALAVEAATAAIAACTKDGYQETAVVVDASGAQQVLIRGDGAADMSCRGLALGRSLRSLRRFDIRLAGVGRVRRVGRR